MNCPQRTPHPLTRKEGLTIWMIEDLHFIYDETNGTWYRRHLDLIDYPALPVSTTLADAFLAFYGLSTDKLLKTLEN